MITDRRGFFKTALAEIARKVADIPADSGVITVRNRKYLRPPGAVEESLFLSRCTRCNECIKACPHYTIRGMDSDVESGIGTPVIIPEITPCRLCPDLPCISACKDKALLPVEDIKDIRIGMAVINESSCLDFRTSGSASRCHECYHACPLIGIAIRIEDSRPVINPNLCTGCGICEKTCLSITSLPAIRVHPY